MADLEQLFRTIDELTPEEKQQVVAYIQGEPTQMTPPKERVFDLHAGMI